MYEFWYNCVKLKSGEKAKLCYMNTHGFIVHLEAEHIYVEIVKDVEQDLIFQIMNLTNYDQEEKIKKQLNYSKIN